MSRPARLTDEERARVRAGCAAADEHFDSYAERCADAATEKALRWAAERLAGSGASEVRELLGLSVIDEVRETADGVALPNQRALDRAVEYLRDMGPEEFRRSLVRAGTHTADGRLVPELREEKTMNESAESILGRMRASGWMVAAHNDYRQNGQVQMFWLLTREVYGRTSCVRGEGASDRLALEQCSLAAKKMGAPNGLCRRCGSGVDGTRVKCVACQSETEP